MQEAGSKNIVYTQLIAISGGVLYFTRMGNLDLQAILKRTKHTKSIGIFVLNSSSVITNSMAIKDARLIFGYNIHHF